MARTCERCGETFETISRFRLHQKNDCPATENIDVSGKSDDDIVNEMVSGLLTCEHCNKKADGAREVEQGVTEGKPSITCRFRCDCGFENRNTGFLE